MTHNANRDATLIAFGIFVAGLFAFGLVHAHVRELIGNDLLFALTAFAYLLAVRYAGKRAAARWLARAGR